MTDRLADWEDRFVDHYRGWKLFDDEMKELKSEGKDLFEEEELEAYDSDMVNMVIVSSKRFDASAFKKDYPDLYKEYMRESSSISIMFKG